MKLLFILTFSSVSLLACSNSATQENNTDSTTTTQQQPVVQQLAQVDLDSMIKKDSVILIDVRTPGEVNQGYIPEADSFIDYNSADFETKINQLDTNYTYVMYCRSGGRSGRASSYMIENGFTKVYNLVGGVLSYKGSLLKP